MTMTSNTSNINSIKEQVYKALIWDYNFDIHEVDDLLTGKIKRLGHYTRESLFRKLIENFPWFTVLKILPPEIIDQLITDEMLRKLRHKSLRNRYQYAKKRLHQIVSSAR